MIERPNITKPVPHRHNVSRSIFETEIVPAGQPVILKDIVGHWPVVVAARNSMHDLAAYLKQFDRGTGVESLVGKPDMKGRYFYNDAMDGFNFSKTVTPLSAIIDQLLDMAAGAPPLMIYAGSAGTHQAAPGFSDANIMPLLNSNIEPRLWLGNTSRVAAHYDYSWNIACCVSGKRRFTVFPPDQIGNLYLGPLEFTMAGPPASMVDFHAPDYERYPKFRDAEKAGMIADLEPGDALYMPALWWHHVEAEGPFNLLVNYWSMPPNSGSVFESVMLALINLRDQPEPDKKAWMAFFEHYVFGPDAAHISDHLPKQWQTVTGAKSPERDQMVMSFIMSRLQE